MACLSSHKRDPIYLSIIATARVWVNLFLKPLGIPMSHDRFRTLGTLVLWSVALRLIHYKPAEEGLISVVSI